MSLQRQLLIIIFTGLSFFFLFKAGFLTIQRFLIVPSVQPLSVHAETSDVSTQSSSPDEANKNGSSLLPTELILVQEHIDLPIVPTPLNNGDWQVTTQGVSLLDPNQGLDAHRGYILYGHNWPALLGRLQQAKIGEGVILRHADGTQENYIIQTKFKVTPDRLDVLQYSTPNSVLIYTCIDFMDSHRLVVVAQKQN